MCPRQKTNQIDRHSSPFDIIGWLKDRYQSEQVVMTTAFGMEGCALINMLDQSGFRPTIADIDTGFLFPETHQLRSTIRKRYRRFPHETWQPESSVQDQNRDYGESLWHRDPDLCCQLRKVRPLARNLVRFQVWISGIRKSQSESRRNIEPVQWDWANRILKVCPLANWQRSDVWRYVDAHDVPFNELHKRGYPSVGCTHCTRKVSGFVKLTTYSRSGRWDGCNKTECGLHLEHADLSGSSTS